jgi:transposase
MTLRLRDLTDDERTEVQRITRSHTLGAAFVRRARIVVHAMSGLKAEEIARRMDLCGNTVRHWINRFNARGLDGLEEDVRTGRPPTYSAEQRSAVITAALTRPTELGLPFACWTLDRLVAYLSDHGIAIRRSRISEIFIREGLKWRHDETWFGERVDPDFAKKRGSSNSSTRRHRRAAYAWTRWGSPELSRPAARETGRARGRTGQTGDRLWPTRQRLCLRGIPAGQRCGLDAAL